MTLRNTHTLCKNPAVIMPLLAALLAFALAGCGGAETPSPTAEPTPTSAPAPTEPPVEEPTPEEAEPSPTAAPEEPPPAPIDAIRETVLTRASDPEVVSATLYQLMSVPVPGGESVVFHFEDALGAARVGCSGHAVVSQPEEGTAYTVQGISVFCGPTSIAEPITAYPSQGTDPEGQPATVIYGEIYDEAVVAVRVFYDGGEVNALIIGGGYQAMLPPDATGVVVRAYDAEANVLFEGVPSSSP
ncbi:MAG TPA: hypothetical protein ENI95_03085 [Chloroflexi bacterium]|nr:hypothetical protein [Chloroflexota bacterium]